MHNILGLSYSTTYISLLIRGFHISMLLFRDNSQHPIIPILNYLSPLSYAVGTIVLQNNLRLYSDKAEECHSLQCFIYAKFNTFPSLDLRYV